MKHLSVVLFMLLILLLTASMLSSWVVPGEAALNSWLSGVQFFLMG